MNALAKKARPVMSLIRVLVPVGFLGLGVLAAMTLFSAREQPPRVERTELATAVRTIGTEQASHRLDVLAWGEVKPSRTVSLQPQVSGRVTVVDEALTPGRVVPKGTLVAQIERRDFELALQQTQAGLATAKFNLQVEEGRSRIARNDFELLGGVLGDLSLEAAESDLALRGPHLREAKSAVEAARTRVEEAQLALARTRVEVPFDAMVQQRTVAEGSLVGPTTVLATLVGIDAWWVEAGVPMEELARVQLPRGDVPGGEATIEVRLADGTAATYVGRIDRLLGSVDGAGRQARVLVQVDRPLDQAVGQRMPLLLGSYVAVTLQGPSRDDAVVLPRSVLREGDVVWVIGVDSRLRIQPVNVLAGTLDTVIVDLNLDQGDRIIASAVPTPVAGMLLVDQDQP
ncbi:MAG: efflux RND transporter periplasmic adaptor subunit [Phycisphaerales bacterium]|nr:efflux RND transporter periplasmic adaptor subunit [Phycisphaerales bacterium]